MGTGECLIIILFGSVLTVYFSRGYLYCAVHRHIFDTASSRWASRYPEPTLVYRKRVGMCGAIHAFRFGSFDRSPTVPDVVKAQQTPPWRAGQQPATNEADSSYFCVSRATGRSVLAALYHY